MKPLSMVVVMLALVHSGSAFSYLDPGSGSAIISVLTATIASLWHSCKSLFFRLTGKKSSRSSLASKENSLVILSEGKAYWGTFRPLIEELIKEKIPFRYRTLDLHDPALTIENQYMESKRLSLNPFGLAELSKIKAPAMIATTPNIGTKGYPIVKPKGIRNLIHVFHHVGDISIYKKNSLDNYDTVIMAGDFQEKSIRTLEKLRNQEPKNLLSLGLLYLDDLYQNRPAFELPISNRTTILVGSSWGNKGCLQTYGTGFIKNLISAGFNLIIRPHPQSYVTEPEFIEKCKRETQSPLVKWDEQTSPTKAMHESQILISDTSSLRFDYAFLYEKPIITLEIPKDNLTEFEAVDLDEVWHESAAFKIGSIVNKDSIIKITEIVSDVLKTHTSSDLQSFKQQTVMNFGECAPSIVKYIKTLKIQQET